jgi:2-C-methyl-D-erythritol 4-phosphate cytidylyltransferase
MVSQVSQDSMVNESQYFLVMPCAGSGLRAGGVVAKQYQDLQGIPLVVRSLQGLARVPQLKSAVLVVSKGDNLASEVMTAHGCAQWFEHFNVLHEGGATRMESVLAGVRSLAKMGAKETDWVLVHDAARCLIQPEWVQHLIQEVGDDAVGGILAWPLSDTLKQATASEPVDCARISSTLPRAHKWLAQTPQMFRVGPLQKALERATHQLEMEQQSTSTQHAEPSVTDEASAMEAVGLEPMLVKASALNIKVTYAEDFALASALLSILEV